MRLHVEARMLLQMEYSAFQSLQVLSAHREVFLQGTVTKAKAKVKLLCGKAQHQTLWHKGRAKTS